MELESLWTRIKACGTPAEFAALLQGVDSLPSFVQDAVPFAIPQGVKIVQTISPLIEEVLQRGEASQLGFCGLLHMGRSALSYALEANMSREKLLPLIEREQHVKSFCAQLRGEAPAVFQAILASRADILDLFDVETPRLEPFGLTPQQFCTAFNAELVVYLRRPAGTLTDWIAGLPEDYLLNPGSVPANTLSQLGGWTAGRLDGIAGGKPDAWKRTHNFIQDDADVDGFTAAHWAALTHAEIDMSSSQAGAKTLYRGAGPMMLKDAVVEFGERWEVQGYTPGSLQFAENHCVLDGIQVDAEQIPVIAQQFNYMQYFKRSRLAAAQASAAFYDFLGPVASGYKTIREYLAKKMPGGLPELKTMLGYLSVLEVQNQISFNNPNVELSSTTWFPSGSTYATSPRPTGVWVQQGPLCSAAVRDRQSALARRLLFQLRQLTQIPAQFQRVQAVLEPMCAQILLTAAAGYNPDGGEETTLDLCLMVSGKEAIRSAMIKACARMNLPFIRQLLDRAPASKSFPAPEELVHHFGYREISLEYVGKRMELLGHFSVRRCVVSALQLLVASVPRQGRGCAYSDAETMRRLAELQVGMCDELGQPALLYAYCIGVPELIPVLEPAEWDITDVFGLNPAQRFAHFVETRLQLNCMDLDGRVVRSILAADGSAERK